MKKLLISLALGLALIAPAQAEVWQARYGVAETFNFKLYNADGTLDVDEADGGTEVSLSCNEGAETTATNDFADEGTFYSIALTATEMQCERIAVVIAATTTEVFFIQTINHASAFTPNYWANVKEWTDSDLLTGTGPLAGLGIIDRGTAQSDSTTTLQLRSAATFADDEPNGGFALIYSATTGAGQRCLFSDYVSSTDTGTCAVAMPVDPTGTVRYELYGSPSASLTGTQTFNMTGNITGNLSGSVGSVTGAVGSVTGNVGGNVAGSVASVTNLEQFARADAAVLNCTVNTANFAGSSTTLACILTDRDDGAVTIASNDLEGRELLVLSGTQIYEGRFIIDSTWDGANSEARFTLARALPGTLADGVLAIIR